MNLTLTKHYLTCQSYLMVYYMLPLEMLFLCLTLANLCESMANKPLVNLLVFYDR